MILFKYRQYSARSLEMLVKRQVYFALPDQLNDPYDCRVGVRAALEEAIKRATEGGNALQNKILVNHRTLGEIHRKIESDLAGVGVFSLSKSATNAVMWAHYADNHQGFCAGFELSEKFTTHNMTHQIVGAADVRYCIENPFIEFFAGIASRDQKIPWGEYWPSFFDIGMVAKGLSWAYEEEVRILRKVGGPVSFDPSELREIVYGMNMPSADRETLRAILSGAEWKHVQFKEIIGTDGFSLAIQDLAT